MKNHCIAKPDPRSDSELLQCFVQSRDDAAFEQLVRRYERLVYFTCWRVLSQAHEVDDAFQATFITLARVAHKIRSTESLSVWLHRVAYREATRMSQRQQRLNEEPLIEAMLDHPGVVEQMAQRYQQQVVDQELDRMPTKYRRPLVLFYFCGRTYREIAEELQLSVAAVESRLRRGLREMRRRVTKRGVSLPAMAVAMSICHEWPARSATDLLIHQTVGASVGAFQQGWFSRIGTQIQQPLSQGLLFMKLPVTQSIMIATFIALLTGWILLTTDSTLKARVLPIIVPGSGPPSPGHFSASLSFSGGHQEDKTRDQPLGRRQRQVYHAIKELLDHEVDVLQVASELTDQQLAEVKRAAQQVTDATKQRIRSEVVDPFSLSGAFELQYPKADAALKNAFHKLVDSQTLSRDQWQRYDQDQQARRILLADTLRVTTAARFELQFVPHDDQLQQFQRLVDRWIGQQTPTLTIPKLEDYIDKGGVLNQLPQAQLQACLNSEQWNHYSEYRSTVGEGRLEGMSRHWYKFEKDPDATKAKARKLYQQYLSLICHRLELELDLTAKQSRRLELAGKRVIGQLIRRHVAAVRYSLSQQKGASPDDVAEDEATEDIDFRALAFDLSALSQDIHECLLAENLLDKIVKGVLDEDQQARLAELRKARSELMLEANLSCFVITRLRGECVNFFDDPPKAALTGNQLRQLDELIKVRMKPKDPIRLFPDMSLMYGSDWILETLTAEDLLSTLTEKQASEVAAVLSLPMRDVDEAEADHQVERR